MVLKTDYKIKILKNTNLLNYANIQINNRTVIIEKDFVRQYSVTGGDILIAWTTLVEYSFARSKCGVIDRTQSGAQLNLIYICCIFFYIKKFYTHFFL